MRRRVIAVLLSLVMVSGCSVQTIEVEPVEETEEVTYLTDEDFSKLYSYKPEIRIEDPYDFTQDEATLMMKVAAHESQGIMGQYMVMCVIANRLRSDQFPNTIGEIIFQDKQFTTAKNLERVEVTADTHFALSLLERGLNYSRGALYFESSSNSPNSWHAKNLTFLFELYGNRYYR